MVKNKNELRVRQIRVFEDTRPDDDLHYKYIFRGYEYPFAIMRDVVKSRISIMMGDFTFLPNEMQQVGNKSGETRLGFSVLFKFFQYEARFPLYLYQLQPVKLTSPVKHLTANHDCGSFF
ncbi:hypothetical protein [Paenibacillus periandrae]|uniref:hypothetical protein n=1 Tax=Paenibacillus periandrae TaxID=1761741 RepID=UPI001F095838|nr:hypothetical protein [Paenibacillus periandrae]